MVKDEVILPSYKYHHTHGSTPPSEYTTILLHSEDLLSKAIYSLETVNHPLLTLYTINSHSYYLLHYQFHPYNYSLYNLSKLSTIQLYQECSCKLQPSTWKTYHLLKPEPRIIYYLGYMLQEY